MNKKKIVVDRNGVRYELTEMLGRGGQGVVYAVKGGHLAVKILASNSRARRERLRNLLMHIRRLPLSDLALAKPLEMLRPPHTGYVMEMLTDMEPIKSLVMPTKGKSASSNWYLSGGGLRRRLILLGRTARVLSQLHGKGLAYSDPSPENIFISAGLENHEVRFIDTDNLQYESAPQGSRLGVFTPGFGAPELVAGKSGVTTLTDAFAFAIIAFQCLTLAHPFIGDMVNGGPPEEEEKAFAGKHPWIDDPNDNRNRASFGVPRDWVLSPRLFKAFGRTFCPGRTDPAARPSAGEWADRLFTAADATITCPECSGTFFFNQTACPWCDHPRPGFATAVFYLWDPKSGPQGDIVAKPRGRKKHPVLVGHGAVSDRQTFIVTHRLAFGHTSGPVDEPVVSVSLNGNQISLKSLNGGVYRLLSPSGGKQTELSCRQKSIKIEEGRGSWQLHFGGSGDLHRVVSFELRRGESP